MNALFALEMLTLIQEALDAKDGAEAKGSAQHVSSSLWVTVCRSNIYS